MIERERRGDVVVLRLVHGKANAMDAELCEELVAELDAAWGEHAGGAAPRAIVLTGRGTIFSAGVDLIRLREGGDAYRDRFLPALSRALFDLFFFPAPVVAAVQGHAIAGGCLAACACDYRVMARGKGRMGVPELKVGVPFPAVALEILRFALPAHRIQEIIYTGRTYEADAAREVGLVDEVVEGDRCLDRALEVARALAAAPSDSVGLTKRQLRQESRDFLERHGVALDAEVSRVWASEEARAAIDRYVDATLRRR